MNRTAPASLLLAKPLKSATCKPIKRNRPAKLKINPQASLLGRVVANLPELSLENLNLSSLDSPQILNQKTAFPIISRHSSINENPRNNFRSLRNERLECQEATKLYDNLYVGSLHNLNDANFLNDKKVTAILSIIEGDLTEKITKNLEYREHMQIRISDNGQKENIEKHFDSAIQFIQNNECTFVHCHAGVSRSVCICLAYMLKMKYYNEYDNALRYIQSKRPVANPNCGFLFQIVKFNKKLQERTVK